MAWSDGKTLDKKQPAGSIRTEEAPKGAPYLKMDETENEYRFRVREPNDFTPNGLKNGNTFAVKRPKHPRNTSKAGQERQDIYYIVGKPKGCNKTRVQSVRFKKSGYTEAEAKKKMNSKPWRAQSLSCADIE